jgi:hypothetical protein
MTEGIN